MLFIIDSTQTLALYHILLFGIFAQYGALVSLHSKPRHSELCTLIAHDFPKTSYMEYIARLILSSLLYYILVSILIHVCRL